ncbi:hypothetical protein [Bradyrhizobium cenepequi]
MITELGDDDPDIHARARRRDHYRPGIKRLPADVTAKLTFDHGMADVW